MKYDLHLRVALLGAICFSFPLAAHAAPGDEHWAHVFGGPGPTNSVFALAVRGERVYASGVWSAGLISTNNWIEVWDGLRWSALPGLFTGSMPIYDSREMDG